MGTELSSQPDPGIQSEEPVSIRSAEESPAKDSHKPVQRTPTRQTATDPVQKAETEKTAKSPCVFRWPQTANEVFIAGTFSNWEKIPLNKSTDDFNTIVELSEGTHEYKFYVDGAWRQDPDVRVVADPFGGLNNVIEVYEPSSQMYNLNLSQSLTDSDRPESPEGEYGQEMPKVHGKMGPPAPPEFPKQLTQMPQLHINPSLSGQTTDQTTLALSEEPSHVCLNHLYAISLKNCTVLATPQRHRDKFYTTLLYKPI